jgi:hypothetical protein
MSLEEALNRNTAAVERLIAVMQSTSLPETPAGEAPATAKATRGGKGKVDAPAPSPTPAAPQTTSVRATVPLGAANDGKTPSLKLAAGDPEGTLYFHVAAHSTVAAVKPGEVVPNMAGLVEVDGEVYATLKAQYAAKVPPAAGAAPAASPAPATPSASTASSSAPATSPQAGSADTGAQVLAKCQALHKAKGNPALAEMLKTYGVDRVPALVALTDKHAAILDALAVALGEKPAAAAEGVDLF